MFYHKFNKINQTCPHSSLSKQTENAWNAKDIQLQKKKKYIETYCNKQIKIAMITNTQRVKINSEMNEKRRTDEAINIIKEETDKSEIPMVATTIRRKKKPKIDVECQIRKQIRRY